MTASTLEDTRASADTSGQSTVITATTRRPVTFFSLPRSLRDEIYSLALTCPSPVQLYSHGPAFWSRSLRRPYPWLSLLQVCRQARDEAEPLVYHLNIFRLNNNDATDQLLAMQHFLRRIGPVNAACLSHLQIYFPSFVARSERPKLACSSDTPPRAPQLPLPPPPWPWCLDGACVRMLELLRDQCTGLKQLMMCVAHYNSDGLTGEMLDGRCMKGFRCIQDVVPQTHIYLQGISSLQTVIVRFCHYEPRATTLEMMKIYGWIVYYHPEGMVYPGQLC